MTRHGRNLLFIVVLCGVTVFSCTQQRQICLTPKIASLNIEFMHLPTDTSTVFADTGLPAGVFVALTNKGATETVFPQQQANFTISLSPDSNVCQWLFRADTLGSIAFDTLTFYYKRNLEFLSNACGFTYFYDLDSIHTTHYGLLTPQFAIDSAHIINASVTNNVNTKHLQIYIHR